MQNKSMKSVRCVFCFNFLCCTLTSFTTAGAHNLIVTLRVAPKILARETKILRDATQNRARLNVSSSSTPSSPTCVSRQLTAALETAKHKVDAAQTEFCPRTRRERHPATSRAPHRRANDCAKPRSAQQKELEVLSARLEASRQREAELEDGHGVAEADL